MLGHTCVLGAWLCLNCMGHHVWKVDFSLPYSHTRTNRPEEDEDA